jgi:co-chaperonin GroES (HSP10)
VTPSVATPKKAAVSTLKEAIVLPDPATLVPMKDRILIEYDVPETRSGIILSGEAREQYMLYATVVAMGPETEGYDLNLGDTVLPLMNVGKRLPGAPSDKRYFLYGISEIAARFPRPGETPVKKLVPLTSE